MRPATLQEFTPWGTNQRRSKASSADVIERQQQMSRIGGRSLALRDQVINDTPEMLGFGLHQQPAV
jgi:hypothetical protein